MSERSEQVHDALPERRSHFLYVMLPDDIEPDERHARYGAPLDAELRLAGIGGVTGGGTMMRDREEDDEPVVLFCGIDIEASDIEAARAVLREHLPALGCPPGTAIEYRNAERVRCDRYDGNVWWLAVDPDDIGEAR